MSSVTLYLKKQLSINIKQAETSLTSQIINQVERELVLYYVQTQE